MQITLWGDIASYFIPAPAGPVNHLGYLYLRIYRICTVLITMWGDVASCTCWTTLCICIWVFVFLFVFLYLCISILHLCIFICPFVFSYSANQPVRRCSAWWTTLSNAAMNHDYTLWCAGAVCILHHHLTVSRSYFAILSRTYLITIIHTHTRKISGDQNFNFIFEEHKTQSQML